MEEEAVLSIKSSEKIGLYNAIEHYLHGITIVKLVISVNQFLAPGTSVQISHCRPPTSGVP